MENQFKTATKRKKELEQLLNKIYQDWVSRALTEENFKRILHQCQDEQKKQDAIISAYTDVIEKKEQTLSIAENAISILDRYADIKELNAVVLNELIKKIVIGEVEKGDGKAVQTMEIYFRFPYIATFQVR